MEGERPHSLDQRPPAVSQAQLQLLQYAVALLHLWWSSVLERHVVNDDAPLLVGIQQRRNMVLVQFVPGAEDKHLLHTLVQELLCPAGSPRHNRREAEKAINDMKSVAKTTAAAKYRFKPGDRKFKRTNKTRFFVVFSKHKIRYIRKVLLFM